MKKILVVVLYGTLLAGPLINLLGEVGTIILCIGVAVLLLVFMFGIRPAEVISELMDNAHENREERKQEKREARLARKQKFNEENTTKETQKQRRLREKEEERRQAEELAEQITINLNDEPADDKKKTKTYNHDKDNLIPFNIKKGKSKEEKQEANPDFIDANLFKTEQETKEEKVKEVLQLEHTLTVEDEHYEFPPIQLLSEGDKKANKLEKRTVTDTATKLQKTLYSFGVSAKVENVSVGPAITRYELKPAEGVRVKLPI